MHPGESQRFRKLRQIGVVSRSYAGFGCGSDSTSSFLGVFVVAGAWISRHPRGVGSWDWVGRGCGGGGSGAGGVGWQHSVEVGHDLTGNLQPVEGFL